ncbi:hypothetical protein [Fictibacillus enclensis]|uniref:hypothetical protein n=1 Tax=Fictibacillus enclensis TaxID=1017270 RepID=UPI0025A24306|nr:hypothetical protein [Fictibacillus enclensis]
MRSTITASRILAKRMALTQAGLQKTQISGWSRVLAGGMFVFGLTPVGKGVKAFKAYEPLIK